ncbi:MAG: helicase-associated domain-containing protein [Microbacterium sp.]
MTDSVEDRIRSLAELLTRADDGEVARILAERSVPANAAWHDWFDAAEALLAPVSVAAAVSRLPRRTLHALATGSAGPMLGLTDAAGRPYATVAAAIPDDIAPVPDVPPDEASPAASAHAAEQAFTNLSAMADLLIDALRTPLSRVDERLGANERRRVVQEGLATDPEVADTLIATAAASGLVRAEDRRWLVTDDGVDWVTAATPDRWARAVTRLREALPSGFRPADDAIGWIDPSLWPDAHPLDPGGPALAARWTERFRLVGLIADDGEPPWASGLRRGDDCDPAELLALLPAEVDQVFLQNDLTAISPGPLAPPLDVRLRRMAVRESHAQASSYRFTEGSLSAALSSGETAETIREFLESLSLTGVPQPLSYLVDRSAARHGLVRVSQDPDSGHTVVSSRDHHLIRTIAVDQSLRALGLVPDGALLRTRADRRAVYWALVDERYPAVPIDDDGRQVALDRYRIASSEAREPHRYAGLIARLRDSESQDADAAWLERSLEAAVREKAALVVAVAMPDGSSRELTIEASGIGGGRLRGLDRGADVERTLPVRSITAVRRA